MDVAVVAVTCVGLGFAFLNGFHDAGVLTGNAVFARALTPRWALMLATFFNFAGALVGQGITILVVTSLLRLPHTGEEILLVIATALVSSVVVNLVTYLRALPVASTHLLFGGLIGAGFVVGFEMDDGPTVIFSYSLLPLLVSPIFALVIALLAVRLANRVLGGSAPKPLFRASRQLDSVMIATLSLAHGSQDAQKIGAVLAIAWAAQSQTAETVVPIDRSWVLVVLVASALAAGTLCSGWRVAHTVSKRMVQLDPLRAAVADSVSVAIMSIASFVLRVPLSLNFIVVGSVLGTQLGSRWNTVHLPTVAKVAASFALGIPVTAALAAGLTWLFLPVVAGI